MENNQSKHKTWWDEKEEVIRLQVIGSFDEQDAEATVSKIAEIKQQFLGKKHRFLIDLTQATTPTSAARKIIADKIYKDPDLEKIAAIAKSILVRTVNSFLVKASGESEKVKMFATEAEALKWLKE